MSSYAIPGSIIIAGLVIAGAIVGTGGGGGAGDTSGSTATHQSGGDFGNNNSAVATNVRPVSSEEDHIFGNPDAPVTIVEYSDFECPFCRRLHPTLTQIIEESEGQVRWVYRHFPLTSIHSRALSASFASECVAELADNDTFWEYGNELFANQQRLGDELYANLATQLGIDEATFTQCYESERHRNRVAADQQNAIDSGGRGTPFSIVITEGGEVFPFSGALPYESVRQIVNAALAS